jgi:hypothetical protein
VMFIILHNSFVAPSHSCSIVYEEFMTKEVRDMKKLMVVAAVVVAIALLGTGAYAARQGWGPGSGGQVDVKAFRQFQQETSTARDEMMAKGLELRNEFAKENPDQGVIDSLKNDMRALRTSIQAAAEKHKLPAWGMGRGAGRGYGGRMMGGGGCGGPGAGGGLGCAQGDCPKQ